MLMVGANDICGSCHRFDGDPVKNADNYEKYLREILSSIHTRIPRVFVNLMPIFNISQGKC